jgi:hypothetical protein
VEGARAEMGEEEGVWGRQREVGRGGRWKEGGKRGRRRRRPLAPLAVAWGREHSKCDPSKLYILC